MSSPQPLGELTTEQFRQKLAGLLDPQEAMADSSKQTIRLLAIDFVSALPRVFGDDLDRKTLWDRIGSGLQTAYAKTAGADVEFFFSEVFRHIHAGTAAAREDAIATVLGNVVAIPEPERRAFITYCSTHMPVLLVHARARWTEVKELKKGGAK